MKRLFLIFLVCTTFNSILNAAPYEHYTKCPYWEYGQIVYYNGVQQNVNGSTPPLEFCWDATRVEGLGLVSIDGVLYESPYENLITNETLFFWFGNKVYYTYGEDYVGLVVKIVVMGYEQKAPIVWLNSVSGTLVSQKDFTSPSGNVFNGREYTFFIRNMPLSQYTGDFSELKMDGELRVYSGSNTSILKDSVYIN